MMDQCYSQVSNEICEKTQDSDEMDRLTHEYLDYLYSDEGQELAAKHFFRRGNETILSRYSNRYKPLELFTVDEIAGSWQKA